MIIVLFFYLFNKQNEPGLHKRIHVKTGVIVRFRNFPFARNINSANIFSPAQFLFISLWSVNKSPKYDSDIRLFTFTVNIYARKTY